jgi:hypothetical protein
MLKAYEFNPEVATQKAGGKMPRERLNRGAVFGGLLADA